MIQALRNVTFILQAEKHSIDDFDSWYERWQEPLRADAVCKWIVSARNTVVKQGELDAESTAIVRLVTWRDQVLIEAPVAPSAPSLMILRNLPLVELVNNMRVPEGDLSTRLSSLNGIGSSQISMVKKL